jgi:hypothetical protein
MPWCYDAAEHNKYETMFIPDVKTENPLTVAQLEILTTVLSRVQGSNDFALLIHL